MEAINSCDYMKCKFESEYAFQHNQSLISRVSSFTTMPIWELDIFVRTQTNEKIGNFRDWNWDSALHLTWNLFDVFEVSLSSNMGIIDCFVNKKLKIKTWDCILISALAHYKAKQESFSLLETKLIDVTFSKTNEVRKDVIGWLSH